VQRGLILAAALAIAGCASAPAPAERDVPQLRLAPSALPGGLALLQHIEVRAAGQQRAIEVQVEVDGHHARMAMLAMGQVAAKLDWDGATLEETRAPWWPAQVAGSRILSDLQLAYWPLPAIQAALPAGWSVAEADGVRELRQGGELVTTVARSREGLALEIDQRRAPYHLSIASVPLDRADPEPAR